MPNSFELKGETYWDDLMVGAQDIGSKEYDPRLESLAASCSCAQDFTLTGA